MRIRKARFGGPSVVWCCDHMSMGNENSLRCIDPRSFAAALAIERGAVCVAPGVLAVPLKRGKGPQGLVAEFALISADDRHLAEFNWSKNRCGYARRRESQTGRGIQMHREVMGMPRSAERGITGDVVDHLNRDKLDNRRENLRVCTQAENCQNTGSRGGSSEHRGVSFKKSAGKWYAHGTLDGKMHGLGLYDDEMDAVAARQTWEREHMPFSVAS